MNSDESQGSVPLRNQIPDRHLIEVGRVAVHAAWLEEALALILYASKGKWDMTTDHLRLAGSKQRLLSDLKNLVEAMPENETRTYTEGSTEARVEIGVVKNALRAFSESLPALFDRRDRLVHSVPWFDWFGNDIHTVHPRSMGGGTEGITPGLPTAAESEALVADLLAKTREAHDLAPQVGATMNPTKRRGRLDP